MLLVEASSLGGVENAERRFNETMKRIVTDVFPLIEIFHYRTSKRKLAILL